MMIKHYNKALERNLWYFPGWDKPTRTIKIPGHGANTYLWFWAKYDRTTAIRVFTTIAAILLESYLGISLFWIAVFETGIQIANGTGTANCIGVDKCSQAFNLIDWGMVLVLVFAAWRLI